MLKRTLKFHSKQYTTLIASVLIFGYFSLYLLSQSSDAVFADATIQPKFA